MMFSSTVGSMACSSYVILSQSDITVSVFFVTVWCSHNKVAYQSNFKNKWVNPWHEEMLWYILPLSPYLGSNSLVYGSIDIDIDMDINMDMDIDKYRYIDIESHDFNGSFSYYLLS